MKTILLSQYIFKRVLIFKSLKLNNQYNQIEIGFSFF
jgi:hypothetical protein